ncbi:MAG: hypothetical protein R3D29_15835 [Nitratireductor sp.]
MFEMVAERGGFDLMPEAGTKPVNKYLPPRAKTLPQEKPGRRPLKNLRRRVSLSWLDRALERLG